LNTDTCKFESLQKDQSRTHSADSTNAYSKLRADGSNVIIIFVTNTILIVIW